ncbi:MAG: hypothetical protein QG661_2948 [Actinomycetota bacterium]|nr:hypothetical protein [Actinomycetota bacterium]
MNTAIRPPTLNALGRSRTTATIVLANNRKPVSEMDDDQRKAVMAKMHGGGGGPFGGSGFNATTSCTYHPPPADDTGCSFGYTNPVTSAVSPTPAGYTYSYGEWWRVT